MYRPRARIALAPGVGPDRPAGGEAADVSARGWRDRAAPNARATRRPPAGGAARASIDGALVRRRVASADPPALRDGERRSAVCVLHVEARPLRDEVLDDAVVSPSRGAVQRGVPLGVRHIEVDFLLDGDRDRFEHHPLAQCRIRLAARALDRRALGDAGESIHREQRIPAAQTGRRHQRGGGALLHLHALVPDGQRSGPVLRVVRRQRIGAALEEQAHDVRSVEARREPERRGADVGRVQVEVDRVAPDRGGAPHRCVRIRAVVQERARQLRVLVQDGRVESRVPGVGGVRIGALVQQERRHVAVPAVRRDDRRAGAVRRLVVHVGARRHEPLGRGEIAHPRGEQQRRVAALRNLGDVLRIPRFGRRLDHLGPDIRPGVDCRAVREQHLDDVRVPLGHRPHQRRLVATAARGRVGPRLQELADDVRRTDTGCGHQRRLAGKEPSVGIRTRVQQPPHHGGAAVLGRRPQRRDAEIVGRVHVGPGADQQIRELDLVPVGGPVQRRRAVTLPGGDVGAAIDQRAHHAPLGVAGRIGERLVRGVSARETRGDQPRQDRRPSNHHPAPCHLHRHAGQCRTLARCATSAAKNMKRTPTETTTCRRLARCATPPVRPVETPASRSSRTTRSRRP